MNEVKMEIIDLSSSELHITNDCPFCNHTWMDKVKDNGICPKCSNRYEMLQAENGEVDVTWFMPEVLGKIVSMLNVHGFSPRRTGLYRVSTGCAFSYVSLAKYKTVLDFQLEYPFYANQ